MTLLVMLVVVGGCGGDDPATVQTLTLFVNVCHALSYAHARGVVHRDLKPANIMVGDFGEVYVMDWGLAKVLGQSSAAAKVGRPECQAPRV